MIIRLEPKMKVYEEDVLRRQIAELAERMDASYKTYFNDTSNQNSVKHPNAYKNIKNKADLTLNKKSRKSCKKRKNNLNTANIDAYIKEYIKKHPEVIAEYVKTYIDANLKVDFVKHNVKSDYYNGSDRFTLGLYDGKKLISESTLGITL